MTRTLLTLVISISSSLIVNAQFKKNDIVLGGVLAYGYNSSNYIQSNVSPQSDQKNSYGDIEISAGKAINENTVVGLNLSYQPSTSNNAYGYDAGPLKMQNNFYAVGISYRKYKSLGKEFYFFGEVAAHYSWQNNYGKDTLGNKPYTSSGWGVGISVYPGIAYKISKHFLLQLIIPNLFAAEYTKSSSSYKNGASQNNFSGNNDNLNIRTSLTTNPLDALGIGFQIIL